MKVDWKGEGSLIPKYFMLFEEKTYKLVNFIALFDFIKHIYCTNGTLKIFEIKERDKKQPKI